MNKYIVLQHLADCQGMQALQMRPIRYLLLGVRLTQFSFLLVLGDTK